MLNKILTILLPLLLSLPSAWGQAPEPNSNMPAPDFDLKYSQPFNFKKDGIPVRFEGTNSQYFAVVLRDKNGDKVKGNDYVAFFDKKTFQKVPGKPIYFYGPKRPSVSKTKGVALSFFMCIMLENNFAMVYKETISSQKDAARGIKSQTRYFVDLYNFDGELFRSEISLPNNIDRFIANPKDGYILALEVERANENQSYKEFSESKPNFKVHVLDNAFNVIYINTFKIDEKRMYVSITDIELILGDTPSVAVSVAININDGKKEDRKNREMIVLLNPNEVKYVTLPFVQYKNLTLEPDNFVFDPGLTHSDIHGLSFISATKLEQGKSVAKQTQNTLKAVRDNFYAIHYRWNTVDDAISGEANIHPVYNNPINYNFTLTSKQEAYERKMEKREESSKKKDKNEYNSQGTLELAAILQSPSGNYFRFLEQRHVREICNTVQQNGFTTQRCNYIFIFRDIYIVETDAKGKAIQAYKYNNYVETKLGHGYPPLSFTPILTDNGRPAILINRLSSSKTAFLELIAFNENTTEAFYLGISDNIERMPQVNWAGNKNYDRNEGRLYFVKPSDKKTYRFGSI